MPLELEKAERFKFYKLGWEEKERVLERIRELMNKHSEVVSVIAYGSFLKNYPFRDIDIAVYVAGNPDPLDYKFSLEAELSKHIKLPIDVKILNHAPPWFVKRVLEEGKVLLAKTPLIIEKLYLKALDEEKSTKTR